MSDDRKKALMQEAAALSDAAKGKRPAVVPC
jgi:hypothetical protein